MKVIVNDKDLPQGKGVRKFATNESDDNDNDVEELLRRVGGKYDFIMMVADGEVYGFVGERIHFQPIGDLVEPFGFQWQRALNSDVDFNWLPLDDEYGSDEGGYDDGEYEYV